MKHYEDSRTTIFNGDCLSVLKTMPDESVQCCVTSPPYWGLRDYGVEGQLGLEKTPQEFIAKLVAVFSEVRRVLKKDGTLWVNMGDSYASAFACDRRNVVGTGSPDDNCARPNRLVGGLKEKDLCGIPWRLAFALQADGWYLRSDIIWAKPNPMPESVTDRPTKAHEYIFLLTKSQRYFYDADAVKEEIASDRDPSRKAKQNGAGYAELRNGTPYDGEGTHRNRRSVWTVSTCPYPESHFATYPPDLIKPCILAGTKAGDTVLDPFGGSGTTGQVALELGRKAVLIELNPEYIRLIKKRTDVTPGLPLSAPQPKLEEPALL